VPRGIGVVFWTLAEEIRITMGYFLTIEPETAVPAIICAQPKTHTPASPVKERGYRYLSPEVGRWVNRDPIKEKGGKNLYCFVRNRPVDRTDYRGLSLNDPPGSLPTGCCGGTAYVIAWSCCCNNTITSRTPVGIGVKKCCVYDANSFFPSIPVHCFISTGGHAWGLYPTGIHDDTDSDLYVPEGAPNPEIAGSLFKVCEELKFNPCQYDLAKVKACAAGGGKSQNYISAGTCIGWANSAGNCLSGNESSCQ